MLARSSTANTHTKKEGGKKGKRRKESGRGKLFVRIVDKKRRNGFSVVGPANGFGKHVCDIYNLI